MLGLGEGRPRAGRHLRGLVAARAEQQAGLLERLADRGERQARAPGRARPLEALHQLRLGVRIERSRDRHEPVGRIDPRRRETRTCPA